MHSARSPHSIWVEIEADSEAVLPLVKFTRETAGGGAPNWDYATGDNLDPKPRGRSAGQNS